VAADNPRPYAGSYGFVLQQFLDRFTPKLRLEEFWLDSGLRCAPYYPTQSEHVLKACDPYLEASIAKHKPKVVVCLGPLGLKRMLDSFAPDEKVGPDTLDHRSRGRAGYVEWSSKYQCWVIGTWSPQWIAEGKWKLLPAWLAHVGLALHIAQHGFKHKPPKIIIDPSPQDLRDWARPYLEGAWRYLKLGTDMETPHSKKAAEDELDLGDPSYQIDRVSYAYWPGEGISFPYGAEYVTVMQEIHGTGGDVWIWNRNYDRPRFIKNGLPFKGRVYDSMDLWHAIQTRLPKAINSVAPLTIPHYPRWKHLSDDNPGYYSGVDSSALLDITEVCIPMAQQLGTFDHFLEQMHETTEALDEMEAAGVPIDQAARIAVAKKLSADQAEYQREMELIIPETLKKYDPKEGFVRAPAEEDRSGMVQIRVQGKVKRCGTCNEIGVTKSNHTARKSLSGRGKTAVPNPCWNAVIHEEVQEVQRWARIDPFVPSNARMQEYQRAKRHEPVLNEEKKATFDAKALDRLMKTYKDDLLYPLVAKYKKAEKLQGYTGSWDPVEQKLVGGWQTDANGYIHPHFGHKPATGRLSCSSPNLQNIPRAEDIEKAKAKGDEGYLVKTLFIPEPGCAIVEVDYASIEALLLGYFARDPFYMRLATLGIHDFVNARVLRETGRVTVEPTPSWSDADLKECFNELKERFPVERTAIKKVVYTSNYGGTAYKIYMDDPKVFNGSRKFAEKLQQGYFETFPSIKRYQEETLEQAYENGFLRGVSGLINRFYKVYKWEKTPEGWKRKLAEEANEALAFKPQHAGSVVMKQGILKFKRHHPDIFRTLRLTIHDSLYSSAVPTDKVDEYVPRMIEVMSEPNLCMPCPAEWGRGSHLAVGVDAKVSLTSWAEAVKWKPGVLLKEAA
jgi:DNA polymerase I-like protein with 3'-5' exonuclease and polymerase domains